MAFYETDDKKIHYELTGDGAPLVLIHGLALDLRIWGDLPQFLSQTHQVLTYDLRGHGRTGLPMNRAGCSAAANSRGHTLSAAYRGHPSRFRHDSRPSCEGHVGYGGSCRDDSVDAQQGCSGEPLNRVSRWVPRPAPTLPTPC